MSEYCQTCGSDPAVCRHERSGSLLLESLGFADRRSHRRALRVTPPPVPARPVATTVASGMPTRSTTGLVAELWEAEPELPPFPPPASPMAVSRPLGWLRLFVGLLIALAMGIVAYLGTTAWLEATTAAEVAASVSALNALEEGVAAIEGAPDLVADPSSDVIALGGISTALADLQSAADLVGVAAIDPPDPLAGFGVDRVDPHAARRSALGQVLPSTNASIDRLTEMLSTRLALEALPALPDLPSGTDNATTDQLTGSLIGVVTELRAASGRLPDAIAPSVEAAANELEASALAYLTALRSHDPSAEDLAVDVTRNDAIARRTIVRWLEAESTTLTDEIARLAASVASIR